MMLYSRVILPVAAFALCSVTGCCGFPGASDQLTSKPIGGAVTHFQGEDQRLPGFAEKHFADRPFKVISSARRHRKDLDAAWGGCGPKYAEVFELCDYARKPVAKEVAYLRSLGFKWIGPEPQAE